MDDTKRQAVLERVRKLLALSQSPNENEAAAAAGKAHAILAEHNLELADISGEAPEGLVMDDEFVTDSRPWRRELGANIARLYFCGYFYSHDYKFAERSAKGKAGMRRVDHHVFTGEPHHVVVAKMMFQYLLDAIDGQAKAAAKRQYEQGRVENTSAYMTAFRHGASERLCRRIFQRWLEAKRGEAPGTTGNTLPALADQYALSLERVQKFIAQQSEGGGGYGATGPARNITKAKEKLSRAGLEAGRAAGDKIGLDQQIAADRVKQVSK